MAWLARSHKSPLGLRQRAVFLNSAHLSPMIQKIKKPYAG
jgi:hypothetical protein